MTNGIRCSVYTCSEYQPVRAFREDPYHAEYYIPWHPRILSVGSVQIGPQAFSFSKICPFFWAQLCSYASTLYVMPRRRVVTSRYLHTLDSIPLALTSYGPTHVVRSHYPVVLPSHPVKGSTCPAEGIIHQWVGVVEGSEVHTAASVHQCALEEQEESL